MGPNRENETLREGGKEQIMRNTLKKVFVWALVLGLVGAWQVTTAVADDRDRGGGQSDHGLLSVATGDTAAYAGVGKHKEPWTLHISATTIDGFAGTLNIQFRDGDALTFRIPAGGSFGLTQAFGGVPGTDDLVRITGSSNLQAIVSVQAVEGAKDPFLGDGQKDNFVVVLPGEGPVQSALQPVASGWEVAGPGSDLQ